MGEQPMVSHPDAEAPGNPPQESRKKEGFPTEEEQRCHCAGVKQDHEEDCYPDRWLPKRPVVFEESCHSHNSADAHKSGVGISAPVG
jgi:hypothetical protein